MVCVVSTCQIGEVVTGRENRTGAREHDPESIGLGGRGERLEQCFQHQLGKCIAPVRPVHGDRDHVTGAMYQDKRLGSHEVIMRNIGRTAMINSWFRPPDVAPSTARTRS